MGANPRAGACPVWEGIPEGLALVLRLEGVDLRARLREGKQAQRH